MSHHFGSNMRHEMRTAAVLAYVADGRPVPRIAVLFAKIAGWSAIGAVLAVLAIPVLAILDALTH